MPDRSASARQMARGVSLAVDVVLFTPRGTEFAVLLAPSVHSTGNGRARARVGLPSDALRADESLDAAAARIAREALGAAPSLLDQAAAHGGARRHADAAAQIT